MVELGFPIDWNEFHFLRPDWLYLALGLAVLIVISLLKRKQNEKWLSLIAPHLREFMIIKGNRKRTLFIQLVFSVSLIIGLIALAGPTWSKVTHPGAKLQTPLVILLDMSKSMDSDDLQPTRLERGLFKIEDLLKSNPRARMALIGFAGSAHTIVPLTADYEIIRSHLKHLKTNVMPLAGSNMISAIQLADSIIESTDAPGHKLIIFDDISDAQREYIESKDQGKNRTYLLPLNTKKGSAVYQRKGVAYKDEKGKEVRSSLDRDQLKRLNSMDGINLLSLTLDNSDMEFLSKTVRADLEFQETDKEEQEKWEDQGQFLLIPFGLILLSFFRKGWVLYSLFLLGFSSCSVESNKANWWFSHDYQGQKLSDAGHFLKASDHFDDPLRKGVALYKAERWEEAIEEFEKDSSALGQYNLGLAYAATGNFSAAEAAFGMALEIDSQLQNARKGMKEMQTVVYDTEEVDPQSAQEGPSEEKTEQNIQNQDMEDLGGGGQEATEEEMKKERKEETVSTDMRKGKELEEVPDDIDDSSTSTDPSKILLQRTEDDPSSFLRKKFRYQVKKHNLKEDPNEKPW